ncbi:hypothetical protein [Cohnella laeviribosi]|uniref:hypothetical protein n=1 Tax=Cohnella laeviribosi TaxID=380174 RepID=UPI00036C9A09|nr:hypothetical protein [Cohnella laeviribosi]
MEVFEAFGGDLPARIGAEQPEDKSPGRPGGQYSGTIQTRKRRHKCDGPGSTAEDGWLVTSIR